MFLSKTQNVPLPKISRGALAAPTALIVTFGCLTLFSTEAHPAQNLILATLAYLSVIWGRNITAIIKNVHQQSKFDRIFIAVGTSFFAVIWVFLQLSLENQLFAQRLFTVGPLSLGLAWLASRNVEEVQTARGLWGWWHLNSPRFRSFAAVIHGTGLLVTAAFNEIFIALDNDWIWILACAAIPITTRWCSDVFVIRGLLKRGGVVREKAEN